MKKLMKIVAILACAAILVAGSVAGTFAWLAMKTAAVTNTFTAGNINITLGETTGASYKMVPGQTITKDPKVTVSAGSEACWLFIKVEKENNFDTYLTYEMADGWIELTGETGVYYREVNASDSAQEFYVIKGNKLTAKSDATKKQYDDLGSNYPTLTITAYAVQYAGFDATDSSNGRNVADAWDVAKRLEDTQTPANSPVENGSNQEQDPDEQSNT